MTTRVLLRALPLALLLFATTSAAPVTPPKDDQNTSLPPLTSDDLSQHAAQLFEAIKTGRSDLADSFFFPREPFLTLKDVDDPGHYYSELISAYRRNIRDLHKSRKSWEGAELRGIELVEKPRRIPPGREWNKIGYYRTRGARIEYEIQGRHRFIELHTVISWDGRWYVTHLAPIH
jgi:hypothetical protein